MPANLIVQIRGGSRIFFSYEGCTTKECLLLHFNTSKPLFCRITGFLLVLESRRLSQTGGGGCTPPAPSPTTLGFATCMPSKCNDLSYMAIDLWQEIPYKVHIQVKNQFAFSKCVAENCVLSQQYPQT